MNTNILPRNAGRFESFCDLREESPTNYAWIGPNSALQRKAADCLTFLMKSGKPLLGALRAWAAGIIYAVANLNRFPCGVDGVLDAEFAAFFGMSMTTIRNRAAQIDTLYTIN